MRVRWFQHVPFEGLGSIAPWMQAHGHMLSVTRLFAGEAPPDVGTYDWLIVMGGPMNIHETREYPWLVAEKLAIREAITQGRRVLGICLGAQLMADVLGAAVTRNPAKEIGWHPVELTASSNQSALLADLPRVFEAYHWHGDTFALPPGTTQLARSEACAQQAFCVGERVLALQFHLETTTESAAQLIEHARHELVPAPYIQTAEAMLAEPARFARLNELMSAVLSRMAAG